jgi:hypothetical protein
MERRKADESRCLHHDGIRQSDGSAAQGRNQAGKTYRKNGSIEGSPRDIVDTGAFLASQRRTRLSATSIKFVWGGSGGVDYAGIILSGRPDTRAYPGRNWILPALKNRPMEAFFAAEWRKLEGRGL